MEKKSISTSTMWKRFNSLFLHQKTLNLDHRKAVKLHQKKLAIENLEYLSSTCSTMVQSIVLQCKCGSHENVGSCFYHILYCLFKDTKKRFDKSKQNY